LTRSDYLATLRAMFERLVDFVSGAKENPPTIPQEIPAPEIPRGEVLRDELHEIKRLLDGHEADTRVFIAFHALTIDRLGQIASCGTDSFEHLTQIRIRWREMLHERDALTKKFYAIQAEGSHYWMAKYV
jgi:hypothetical protein